MIWRTAWSPLVTATDNGASFFSSQLCKSGKLLSRNKLESELTKDLNSIVLLTATLGMRKLKSNFFLFNSFVSCKTCKCNKSIVVQHALYSYRQRQIGKSDCDVTANCGKNEIPATETSPRFAPLYSNLDIFFNLMSCRISKRKDEVLKRRQNVKQLAAKRRQALKQSQLLQNFKRDTQEVTSVNILPQQTAIPSQPKIEFCVLHNKHTTNVFY